MKTCEKCGFPKSIEEFRIKNHQTGLRRSHCDECQYKYQKSWYKKNSDRHKANIKEIKKQRMREGTPVIMALKEKPCMDCKGSFPYYVMDFDHRDPKQKKFNIAGSLHKNGLQATLDEIAKCDLVCANCHRIRTFKQFAA